MVWAFLILTAGLAFAEESPSPTPAEPLFCTEPVEAVCEPREKIFADNSEIRKRWEEVRALKDNAARVKAIFLRFQEMEKQSFVPLLDETRARLLDAVTSSSELAESDRAKFKAILENVKFASLSRASDALDEIQTQRQKLPKGSILRRATPEAFDIVSNLRFERMTPLERELVRKILLVKALHRSQEEGCGEDAPLNAFSLGAAWGVPSVALCLDSIIRLQPLDVQARYPMLGAIFGHELGHHLDTGPFPALYTKYLSCLHTETPDGTKKFSDSWSREIVADLWSAAALANMIKTRAALLEESPETERNRAWRFIRGSLHWLCIARSGGPESSHPSGEFRIGRIFGQSPEIRKMLGCKPKPVCTLSGRR